VNRRKTKQRRVEALNVRLALKLLAPGMVAEFERLYARCRTEADFAQVDDVVWQVSMGPAGRTDRYGLLMRDEPLELEV
jgi:hypothetical protein